MAETAAARHLAMTAPSGTQPLDEAAEPRADRRATAGHNENWRSLLLPLSRAQDALARLETAAAMASDAVGAGLVARLALHEAAGWLAHNGTDVSQRGAGIRQVGAAIPAPLGVRRCGRSSGVPAPACG